MNSGASSSESPNGATGSNGSGGTGGSSRGGELALKKGPWTATEDKVLMGYVERYGEGNWNAVRKKMGLPRCGKSCRLRWTNHLRPNLKKGSFSPEEERLILELHAQLGNKWARMAAQLPGRTDNEIKNYWNTRIKRRLRDGLPLYPHGPRPTQVLLQPLLPPLQPPAVKNQLLLPQYHTAIPLFPNQFPSGFHNPLHVFDQTLSPNVPRQTLPVPTPPPRHKQYCNSHAFAISIMPPSNGVDPALASPHSVLSNAPLSFNLNSLQMEMGTTPCPSSLSLVKLELPSSQLPLPMMTKTAELLSDADARKGCSSLLHSDCGLLEDLLEEAHTWVNMSQNKCANAYSKSETNRTASKLVSPSGMRFDVSSSQEINSLQEDLGKLIDCFPPNTSNPTSDVNCGRSLNISTLGYASSAQDEEDNLGLDLQDIAALFPGNSMAELSTLPWENLPGIC